MAKNSKTPETWIVTELKDLGGIVSGGTPSTKEASYWGDEVNWISPSDLTGYTNKTISKGKKNITLKGLQNSSAKVMPAGSVHFSSRAPIGYVVISSEPMSTNQGFKSLVPSDGIYSDYVYYYLKSAKQLAERVATGTTFKEISGTAFAKLPFPLPPTNEQKRIVAKIEELFSELDKGIENLKTASAQLKVYRQALLKNAFEGKLTAKWREDNGDKLESADTIFERIQKAYEANYEIQLESWKYDVKRWEDGGQDDKKPKKPRKITPEAIGDIKIQNNLPYLPKGWHWVPLSWILSSQKKAMTTGPFGTMLKKNEHQKSGIPVLGIENIGEGNFVPGNKIFVTEKKAKELASFEVEAGDIIISRSGTVGEICEIPNNLGTALISTNLLRVSLNQDEILSKFFVLLFQGAVAVKKQVKDLCKGSSRNFLNQSILSSLFFPVPSIEEQDVIVKEVSSRFSVVDKFEIEIEDQLQKTVILRQSILKKAFSGQLVAQDPKDEPASVLLERIRAEKEVQNSKLKKTKSKRKVA